MSIMTKFLSGSYAWPQDKHGQYHAQSIKLHGRTVLVAPLPATSYVTCDEGGELARFIIIELGTMEVWYYCGTCESGGG